MFLLLAETDHFYIIGLFRINLYEARAMIIAIKKMDTRNWCPIFYFLKTCFLFCLIPTYLKQPSPRNHTVNIFVLKMW